MNIDKPIHDLYSHSYISLKNKYFFHSVSKAASSTIKHFLYLGEATGTRFKYENVHDRRLSPLISPFQLPDETLLKIFNSNDFFKFTFIRNPYSRLLSCYLDRILPKKSTPYIQLIRYLGKEIGAEINFKVFIQTICSQSNAEQNNHWRLQYADAMCEIINYNFIGKQENFDNDLSIVWKKLYPNIALPDFKSQNFSPSITGSAEKISKYWNDELRSMVAERYEKDFLAFGYKP